MKQRYVHEQLFGNVIFHTVLQRIECPTVLAPFTLPYMVGVIHL